MQPNYSLRLRTVQLIRREGRGWHAAGRVDPEHQVASRCHAIWQEAESYKHTNILARDLCVRIYHSSTFSRADFESSSGIYVLQTEVMSTASNLPGVVSELSLSHKAILDTLDSVSRMLKSSALIGPSHTCSKEWDTHRKASNLSS